MPAPSPTDQLMISAPGFKTYFEADGQWVYRQLINRYKLTEYAARLVMVESFIGGVSSVRPPPLMTGHGTRGYDE